MYTTLSFKDPTNDTVHCTGSLDRIEYRIRSKATQRIIADLRGNSVKEIQHKQSTPINVERNAQITSSHKSKH